MKNTIVLVIVVIVTLSSKFACSQNSTDNDYELLNEFLIKIESGSYLSQKEQVVLIQKQLDINKVLLSTIDTLLNVHDSLINSSAFKNTLENHTELTAAIMTKAIQESHIRFLEEKDCDCKGWKDFQERFSLTFESVLISGAIPTEIIEPMKTYKKTLEENIPFFEFQVEHDPQLEKRIQKPATEKLLLIMKILSSTQELTKIFNKKYEGVTHIEKGLKEEQEEIQQNKLKIQGLRKTCKCK